MLCQVSHLIIYVKNQGGLLMSQKNKCIKLSVLFSVRAKLNICVFFFFSNHSISPLSLWFLPNIFFTATDLQFAQTLDGRPVPFATAGDCYSAAKCPQVSLDPWLHSSILSFIPNQINHAPTIALFCHSLSNISFLKYCTFCLVFFLIVLIKELVPLN